MLQFSSYYFLIPTGLSSSYTRGIIELGTSCLTKLMIYSNDQPEIGVQQNWSHNLPIYIHKFQRLIKLVLCKQLYVFKLIFILQIKYKKICSAKLYTGQYKMI